MFIVSKPKNRASSAGATWKPTCRPAGAWSSAVIACYKHAAPTELARGRRHRSNTIFRVCLIVAYCLIGAIATQAQEKITYQDHVLPLIENNCGKCHNPDKKKADLDLTS